MFAGKEKAWIAALIGLVSAFVLQMTGSGAGPTPEMLTDFGGMTGEIVSSLVVAGINAFMVYLVPNSTQ